MSAIKEKVVIGDITLLRGDCLEIIPELINEGVVVDTVITDPPYGIDIGGNKSIGGNGNLYKATEYGKHDWDKVLPKKEFYDFLKSKKYIVFGANHMCAELGNHKGVLIWDKKCQNGWNDTFSDAEIAFTNLINNTKVFRHLWVGALRKKSFDEDKRQHPTQKPIKVMEWCLDFACENDLVFDPFMGSGTTAVACQNTGRKCIGIELDKNYFNIAVKRVRENARQGRLDI